MRRFFLTCAWVGALFAPPAASSQTFSSREINPARSIRDNTGGRVNRLGRATDTVIYAASEFGGLFKSTDAGRTWTRLDSHLPTRASDVKASPADPDRVIATSIYDGRINSFAGINVSSDGGATWTKPASATPPTGFCASTNFDAPSAFGIAFDPESPTHVFVGTNCGLATSTDGGLNWTFVNPGPFATANDVGGVAVHHGGIIDTCGSDGHRRSVNGGASWTGAQAGGEPLPRGNCSIAASPDESYVLFATVGTRIFETDSGGGTWNTRFTNPSPQGRVPFVATHKRQGRNFDLWFGDVQLFRAACTTPASPSQGGTARCPASNTWTVSGKGAHVDMGDVVFSNPPRFDVPPCLQACTSARNSCGSECAELRQQCMSEVGTPGGPLAFECARDFQDCDKTCTTRLNACVANCNRPQEGCPIVMSSDGGTYVNTLTQSPACQTPVWTQPDVTTRGLWLWSLSGGNIPASFSKEALYMGTQDNGAFATLNAGAASPTWTNPHGGDVFDVVSDSTQVVYTVCCRGALDNSHIFRRNQGMTGGGEIPNYPPGIVPGFGFNDVIAQFGTNRYAVTTTLGVFVTQNITANPIIWTQLGTNPPNNGCGLWAAGTPGNPTFFSLSGNPACGFNSAGTLRRYSGTSSTGQWQVINPEVSPGAIQAVGIFAVDPNNANRLFVSTVGFLGVHMHRSSDGGTTWQPDAALDGLMSGGGTFRMQVSTFTASLPFYEQPTLVAFDPNDSNNLLAGAADAGIFLSQDNGGSWKTMTNNSGDSGNPVVPRPHWAYFNRECSRYNIYVGTQGRGAWQFSYRDPAGITVSACQASCDAPLQDCRNQCDADLKSCMSKVGEPGEPLASQCLQNFHACRGVCSDTTNACRQRCADCPQ